MNLFKKSKVLSVEQLDKLRAQVQQELLVSADASSTKLPLLTPQERAQKEWTSQLDSLMKLVESNNKQIEMLRGIAGSGQPLSCFTPGLPVGLQPAINSSRYQAGQSVTGWLLSIMRRI